LKQGVGLTNMRVDEVNKNRSSMKQSN